MTDGLNHLDTTRDHFNPPGQGMVKSQGVIFLPECLQNLLDGGFKHFLFSSLFGEMIPI